MLPWRTHRCQSPKCAEPHTGGIWKPWARRFSTCGRRYALGVDLREITYFLAVANAGSFTGAAATLHMTQPPLSLTISKLEKQLGVTLLNRTPTGVTPTPAGEYLAEFGTHLLESLEDAERRVRAIGAGVVGQLSIAAVPAYCWGPLAGVLSHFSEVAPLSEVSLSSVPARQVLDDVVRGGADIGVVATTDMSRLRALHAGRLEVDHCGELPLVAALPPRLRGVEEPVDLRGLLDETWFVPRADPGVPSLPTLLEQIWANVGKPADVRVVSTMQTALPLIGADLGVGLMPMNLSRISPDTVIVRRLAGDVPSLELGVVWSALRPRTPLMDTFLKVVRAHVVA